MSVCDFYLPLKCILFFSVMQCVETLLTSIQLCAMSKEFNQLEASCACAEEFLSFLTEKHAQHQIAT